MIKIRIGKQKFCYDISPYEHLLFLTVGMAMGQIQNFENLVATILASLDGGEITLETIDDVFAKFDLTLGVLIKKMKQKVGGQELHDRLESAASSPRGCFKTEPTRVGGAVHALAWQHRVVMGRAVRSSRWFGLGSSRLPEEWASRKSRCSLDCNFRYNVRRFKARRELPRPSPLFVACPCLLLLTSGLPVVSCWQTRPPRGT